MGGPIVWAGCLLVGDPGAGHIGEKGYRWRPQLDLPDSRPSGLKDRIEHGRVKGVRSGQALSSNPVACERRGEGFHCRRGTGDDGLPRAVDGSQRKCLWQSREDGLLGKRNRKHAPGGNGTYQSAAFNDQGERVFKSKHACDRSGYIFTQAVAKHCSGTYADVEEPHSKCIYKGEDNWLGDRGLPK